MKTEESNRELEDILLDIRYSFSMNKFEMEYGESVDYDHLVQRTYVEVKDIINNELDRKIKFRKHGPREGMNRTIRAELSNDEYDYLKEFYKNYSAETFSFVCDFIVSDIRKMPLEEEI